MLGDKNVDAFDVLMSSLDYPMFVVTTTANGTQAGCLVGFATQVSIDPRRFLVGLSDKNRTFRVAQHAEHLAVHAISTDEHELASLFGEETGDETDKFARCAWHRGPQELPILDDAAAWFIGRILQRSALGDHVAFLLEPEAGYRRAIRGDLLTFRDVQDLHAGHDA